MIILIYNRKVFDDFGGSIDEYIEWLQKKRKKMRDEIKKCVEEENELVREYPRCPVCECRYKRGTWRLESLGKRITAITCPKGHCVVMWGDKEEEMFARLELHDEGYGE